MNATKTHIHVDEDPTRKCFAMGPESFDMMAFIVCLLTSCSCTQGASANNTRYCACAGVSYI